MRMNEPYEDPRAAQDAVRRFERMVAHNEPVFFDLEDFENIIDHYVTTQRYDQALQACDAALTQYPFSTELLIDRAQVMAMKGQYKEAEQQIEEVAALDPLNPDVAVTRGIISTQRGQFAEAVAFFKSALEGAPEREDIHFNLGLAYQSWQKFKSAAKHYKQSLRLNPDNETGVQELLHCLEVTGRLEEHLDFFKQFTDDDPYSAMAWYNLGQYYYRREQYDEAREALEFAIVIDVDFHDAHHWLADTYVFGDLGTGCEQRQVVREHRARDRLRRGCRGIRAERRDSGAPDPARHAGRRIPRRLPRAGGGQVLPRRRLALRETQQGAGTQWLHHVRRGERRQGLGRDPSNGPRHDGAGGRTRDHQHHDREATHRRSRARFHAPA